MKRSKKFLSLILVFVMCLALMPVVVSADDGDPDANSNEHGTPLTIEDEEFGAFITFDGFLRQETHSYRTLGWNENDGDWDIEGVGEYTFYVVEDNSTVHIQALPDRKYSATGYADDAWIEGDDGIWYMSHAYAWEGWHGLDWDTEKNAFVYGGLGGEPGVMRGPMTEHVIPGYNSYYEDDVYVSCWSWNIYYLCESDFNRLVPIDQPVTPTPAPTPTAIAATQTVKVDGKDVTFYAYALSDGKGGLTNYVKLRDVAAVLNGTKGQFEVGWNGAINLETGKPYTVAGGELEKTFEGDQPYVAGNTPVNVNGVPADLEAITLVDSKGGNYNYFKLRDLGEALGFNVGWSKTSGIFIETDKPYTDAD